MRRTTLTLILALFTGLPAAATLAQDKPAAQGPTTVDPAAKEFIDKFRAHVKDIKDINCTSAQKMTTNGSAEGRTGTFQGVFSRPESGPAKLTKFKIALKSNDTDAVWAFDGKSSSRIDNTAKTFMSAETNEAFPAGDSGRIVPTWVYGTDVLTGKETKLIGARMLPDADADGVHCHVVEYQVEFPAPAGKTATMRQVRHVGIDDLISRKIETSTSSEGTVVSAFSATYTNVKVNTNPADAVFALKAPDGFKKADADPEELGIPSDGPPKMKFAQGQAAPDFALQTPDGKEVTLASLKGRVVLLDFWATWCGPCKMAMPGVQKLHEKYQGKPVSIFGVNTWERGSADGPKNYMKDQGYTYGLLMKGDTLAKAYGISGIPTFVLIGQDGKIIHIGVGFDENGDKELAKMIDKALTGGS